MPNNPLTPDQIDGLNYDAALAAVRANHKGTWIASAKLDTLKKVLKGELTATQAAVATLNGGVPQPPTIPQPPPSTLPAPVSLDGVFGAAINTAIKHHTDAVNNNLTTLKERVDDLSRQVGSQQLPSGVAEKIDKLADEIKQRATVIEDLKKSVDDALKSGGTTAARIIAPVLGVKPSSGIDPVTKHLEFYCSPGASLKPVLIKGGPGSGKTYGARAHGKLFDRYVEVAITPDTESSDLLGFPTPKEPWVDGPLTEAFRIAASRKNVLLCMDELFRGKSVRQLLLTPLIPTEINGEMFYRLRTGRPIIDPDTQCLTSEEILAPKQHLAIVATTNVGAKYDVNAPDPAEKERFAPVHVEVEETKMRRVVGEYTATKNFNSGIIDQLVRFWNECKVLVKDNFLEQMPTTRIISEAVLYSVDEKDVPNRLLSLGLHIWVAENLDGLPEPEQCKRVVKALKNAFPTFKPTPTGDPSMDAIICS